MPKKPLIEFPQRHRTTASYWHGGQTSALYAVSSSGAIAVDRLPLLQGELEDCVRIVENAEPSEAKARDEDELRSFYFYVLGKVRKAEIAGLLTD